MKKSLIIIGLFLYFSILITGSPFEKNINSSGNNPFFSLENVSQFVYAQAGGSDKSDGGSDKSDGGSDKSDGGSDKSDGGSDKSDGGSDKSDGGSDKSDGGSDKSDGGSDKSDGGSDKSDGGSDKSDFDPNEANKENIENNTPDFPSNPNIDDGKGSDEGSEENIENNTPDFLTRPVGDTNADLPIGDGDNQPPIGDGDNQPPIGDGDNQPPIGDGDNQPPIGDGDNQPPIGDGDNQPPIGDGDNQPPIGDGDNQPKSEHKNNIKDKINSEFKKITKIISKTNNKVIVKDDSDSEKEIIIVSDTTCPTQSESIELNGIIDPQGIRLLANFYPCLIQNGGITMNIPESPHLNLAVIYIDNNIDNHAGTLISPSKIQNLGQNQGLFSIELDKKMKGQDPITGEITTLEKINGLALYNKGNEPIEFKEGSSVALTAAFTR